jgi:DNA-binding transcriptional ArsR family regulator
MSKSAVQPVGRKPPKERTKRSDEALTHSINHWIRVEVIAILAEGEFSAGEIARMIDVDVKNVRGHVKDLYDSGCIEFAGYKMVSGGMRPIYRALVLPVVYDEMYREMSLKDRHELNGAVVQGILAETVSSYRNEKMDRDEELCLLWDALNLDAEGKRELLRLLIATWEGAQEINGKSANRMAQSGETGDVTFVGLLGFKRGRPGRPDGGYHGIKKS